MKYAHYEKTSGKLLGWYDDSIHSSILTPNIEVTDDEWQEALEKCYNYVDKSTNKLSLKDFRTFEIIKTDKKNEIKQCFVDSLKNGFTCSNNIKMDGEIEKIQSLKSGYDLVIMSKNETMMIRDFNNNLHNDVSVLDVNNMIQELSNNYQNMLNKKWLLEDKTLKSSSIDEVQSVSW